MITPYSSVSQGITLCRLVWNSGLPIVPLLQNTPVAPAKAFYSQIYFEDQVKSKMIKFVAHKTWVTGAMRWKQHIYTLEAAHPHGGSGISAWWKQHIQLVLVCTPTCV
eukprot:TRINITY_DN6364_c1_g1_i16.p1 TRINITY_DN6364_c1_g1~~TRINITY_DN6364_c1_g1_i16.p1  ORF type:complete len:108 (-),score=17.73 TRINITY_DN6364_c1_g1_i16:276-599(-)